MTTDKFTEAARESAEQFLWALPDDHPAKPLHNDGFMQTHARVIADLMAEWARTHLATQEPTDAESIARKNLGDAAVDRLAAHFGVAQEPTDAETGHAYAEWMNHSPIRDLDARRLNCTCGERGFTPYGYEHHRLRAALSAARAARRDEEKR